MHVAEVGVAAAGEGAQQVERRRRLPVGLELPARIGHARLRRELDAVDDVAAIARQLDAVRASRSARSAAWRTGRRCGRPSPPATPPHRSAPPPSAGTRGRSRGCCWRRARRSFRRSRRPAAGKPRPCATRAERLLQVARLAGKHQRRKASRAASRPRPAPAGPDSPAPARSACCASCRASNARPSTRSPSHLAQLPCAGLIHGSGARQ